MQMDLLERTLAARQNIYSGVAGPIASRLSEVRKQVIKESLGTFPDVAHRLEEVGHVRGILFINDSRATNVNAAWYALESMTRPVIWIAGGQDTGNDYASIRALAENKVKHLICLGANNKNIVSSMKRSVPAISETDSMREAVRIAYLTGVPGDIVLLSPACPSFDLFDDYADRGDRFREAVYAL